MREAEARRGYAKGRERREAILAAADAAFAKHGFRGASLATIAQRRTQPAGRAAPLPVQGGPAARGAALPRGARPRVRRARSRGGRELRRGAARVVRRERADAGLVRLFAVLAAESVDDDHPAHELFRKRYRHLRGLVERAASRTSSREGRLARRPRPGEARAAAARAVRRAAAPVAARARRGRHGRAPARLPRPARADAWARARAASTSSAWRRARRPSSCTASGSTGGIPDHPAFRNVVRSYAELYDMQHDPAYRDVLTYASPTLRRARSAPSFLVPRTHEDLAKRRRALFKLWADRSLGMLGRTGDYLNSALMALAAARDWFAPGRPAYGENIRRYYEKVREEDLLLHAHADPAAGQPRRSPAASRLGGALTAHIVSRGRQRHRHPRRAACSPPSARSPTSCWCSRRRCCGARPRTSRTPSPSPSRTTRPACATCARESLDYGRGRATTTRSAPASRRSDAVVDLRRRARAVRALLRARRPRAVQRLLHRHLGRGAHDASGRHPHHRQDRVHPRPALAADRGHRHRAVPARPGGRGRGHHHAGDAARAAARGRGRRGAERVRRAHPGLGAAERRPQPLPPALPAVPRDPAQARRVRPDGHRRPRPT